MNKISIILGSIALISAFVEITNASLFELFDLELAILLLLGFGLITLAAIGRKAVFKKKK